MTTEEHQAAMCSLALSLMAAISSEIAAAAGQAMCVINAHLDASDG